MNGSSGRRPTPTPTAAAGSALVAVAGTLALGLRELASPEGMFVVPPV